MKRLTEYTAVIISILVLITGCNNSTKVVKKNVGLSLNVTRPEKTSVRKPAGICKIRSFRIASPFETNYLVYKVTDYSYEMDYYNRYIVSPSAMVTEQSHKWLAGSGIFENVIDDGSRAEARYLLEGRIKSIYSDFTNPGSLSAVIEIQFVLIETDNFKNSIILDKSYRASTSMQSAEIEEIINAFNGSLEKILESFEADLIDISGNFK